MFNKREAKKNLLKEKILTAAREIFLSQGYEETTIGQIAEKAGVGLGTAYNYFKSKEEIFLLAMAEELEQVNEEKREIETDAGTPEEAITAMVLTSIQRYSFFGKKVWRAAMAAVFISMKSNTMMMHEMMKVDYRLMDKLRDRLGELKNQSRLKESFPIDTAVEVIYGAVIFHVMAYVYSEDVSFEAMCRKIETNIRFVLA